MKSQSHPTAYPSDTEKVAGVEVLQNGSAEDVLAVVTKCHQSAEELYVIGARCQVRRETPAANMFALREFAQSHKPGDAHISG
jgi:hypothetical protein